MHKLLEVENCVLAYDAEPVVRQVSFSIAAGTIGCLLGPSGCGKTTLLRAIAGFETPQDGKISLRGQVVSHAGWALPPEQRKVGMVFQDFALFPHLRVEENIGFGLNHLSERERRARVNELLELVNLSNYARSYPHQLSGGQQQRIAVARAIAPRPELLLLDEPFSSLDVEMREQMAREVREILKQEEIAGLLVTHDQYEAFAMADEIGVMNTGEFKQWDTGYNLYHQPANRFVADFIGQGEILDGIVLNDQAVETELGIIDGRVPEGCISGCRVELLVRPDDIQHDDNSQLQAKVVEKVFRGADFLYTLALTTGTRLLCFAPSHHNHAIGEAIGIRLDIEHLVMFRAEQASVI
ncbi:MAG: ABC transporter ATP-binding protein [Gammaproteobacteria bacterium]